MCIVQTDRDDTSVVHIGALSLIFLCKTCTTAVERHKIKREAEEVVVFTRKITIHNSLYQN